MKKTLAKMKYKDCIIKIYRENRKSWDFPKTIFQVYFAPKYQVKIPIQKLQKVLRASTPFREKLKSILE